MIETRYFTHTEGRKVAKWLKEMRAENRHTTLIGHSMGGRTAASIVAKGNYVDVLVTVDPVTGYLPFRPKFEKVAEHSGAWRHYYSRSKEAKETAGRGQVAVGTTLRGSMPSPIWRSKWTMCAYA